MTPRLLNSMVPTAIGSVNKPAIAMGTQTEEPHRFMSNFKLWLLDDAIFAKAPVTYHLSKNIALVPVY